MTSIVSGAMRSSKQKHPTRRGPPSRLIQFHVNYTLRHASLHVSADGASTTFLRDETARASLSSSYLDALAMWDNESGAGCAALSPIWEALGIGPEFHCHLYRDLLPKIKEAAAGRALVELDAAVRPGGFREGVRGIPGRRGGGAVLSGLGKDGGGMVPAAREAVAALVKDVEGGGEEACAVCLEEVCYGGAEMPCGHLFHGACIRKWLELSHYCPVCRFEMPTVGAAVAGVGYGGTSGASEEVAGKDS
ncbi:unnamed protein product [Linum trigynum]